MQEMFGEVAVDHLEVVCLAHGKSIPPSESNAPYLFTTKAFSHALNSTSLVSVGAISRDQSRGSEDFLHVGCWC